MSNLVKYSEPNSSIINNKLKKSEEQGREFIYNDISAGMFQVII